ncbi:hypothetical protein MKX64_16805 [Paenibacillus sp. FSL M8-0334]|uniref:hypothetical protein n=1 Tax=Paenibacillus sp. FSL M8-0334 TaxID=2921623 RepID=UPI0030FC31A2
MTRISVTLQSETSSKLLMTIKKHTGLGLSDIKTRTDNNTPLMEVDYVNNEEMEKMKDLVEDLIDNDASFQLFEQDGDYKEELPLDHFMNSFEMSRQIAEDRERMDDILVEEDEE